MNKANAPKALRNVQKEEAARKLFAQQEEELPSVGLWVMLVGLTLDGKRFLWRGVMIMWRHSLNERITALFLLVCPEKVAPNRRMSETPAVVRV